MSTNANNILSGSPLTELQQGNLKSLLDFIATAGNSPAKDGSRTESPVDQLQHAILGFHAFVDTLKSFSSALGVLESSFHSISVPPAASLLSAAKALKSSVTLLGPSYSSILLTIFPDALADKNVWGYYAAFQQRPLVTIQPNKHAFLGDCERVRVDARTFIAALDGVDAEVRDEEIKRALRKLSELLVTFQTRFPGLEQFKRNAVYRQLPDLTERFKFATEKLIEFNGSGPRTIRHAAISRNLTVAQLSALLSLIVAASLVFRRSTATGGDIITPTLWFFSLVTGVISAFSSFIGVVATMGDVRTAPGGRGRHASTGKLLSTGSMLVLLVSAFAYLGGLCNYALASLQSSPIILATCIPSAIFAFVSSVSLMGWLARGKAGVNASVSQAKGAIDVAGQKAGSKVLDVKDRFKMPVKKASAEAPSSTSSPAAALASVVAAAPQVETLKQNNGAPKRKDSVSSGAVPFPTASGSSAGSSSGETRRNVRRRTQDTH